jgi:hypothetical protein
MDLRDHFAGLAMQAMMDMHREMFLEDNLFEHWVEEAMPYLAKEAYEMADYMMIARKNTNTYASKHGERLIFGEGEE